MRTLSDEERLEMIAILERYQKEVKHNKELAKELLIGAGILTKRQHTKGAGGCMYVIM